MWLQICMVIALFLLLLIPPLLSIHYQGEVRADLLHLHIHFQKGKQGLLVNNVLNVYMKI